MLKKTDNLQKVKHVRYGICMKLALIIIYILSISATDLTVHSAAVSDDIIYEDRNSPRWWYNSASKTYWDSEMECLDYFDNERTNFADRGYYAIYTGAELSITHGNEEHESASGPSLGYNDYDEVVSRIKNAYQELDAKDQDDYTRLLLLYFGIVGIIGVRRTVKKSSSAQKISRREVDFTGFKATV